MKAQDMTKDELLMAARNMEKYGGGFVQAIALAYFRADTNNAKLLIKTFDFLFENYAKWEQNHV